MSKDNVRLVEREPSVAEYQRLRRSVSWPELSDETVAAGLQRALYSICLLRQDEVIGCGRIVGDGAIYFYLQDVIVLPEYQRRGFGKMMMDRLMSFLEAHAGKNSFVGLMAAKDVAEFYRGFGFAERPANRPGMFMMWPGDE